MAIAQGRETKDFQNKLHIGHAPVFVLGVNLNSKETKEILDYEPEEEPSYTGTFDRDGNELEYARIQFVIKTDTEEVIIKKIDFTLTNTPRTNADNTKVQVIDKYGRTAWVTKEEFKTKSIPMYSNGPANLDADYRACFQGEEDLTNFIQAYLNIPSVQTYDRNSKTWKLVANPEDSECRLDNIKDYFKGDFSEIKTVATMQPNNKVKVLFGVKKTDNGNMYQDFFSRMVLKSGSNNYNKLSEEVANTQAAGGYPLTEFVIHPIREYKVEATDFNKTNSSEEVSSFFPEDWAN